MCLKEDSVFQLSPTLYYTIFYAIVAILLNIIGLLEGPYPFLMIRKNGVIQSIIWLIIMIGISYLISFGLLKIKNKNRC